MDIDFSEDPHRRYNILTGEWVLVSPHRAKRPWQGREEKTPTVKKSVYDPNCFLCPGNTRMGGHKNPKYTGAYVFTNDFAALKPDTGKGIYHDDLLLAKGEPGICRVVCFSPDHSLTIPEMTIPQLESVIILWQREYADLGMLDFINHVQIFENKGEIMGCSNPHPHGQIWAQYSLPQEVVKRQAKQFEYWDKNGRSLLQDYLKQELELEVRLICQNDHFVALVPFWAVWPYEAMIIPKRHFQHIGQLTPNERTSFASILKELTQRFELIFNVSFPYSSGIHQCPTDTEPHPEWHFHMSFYPPLLRSATVKKFMVGYEMFANPQRDITPEMSARKMREVID